MHLVAGFECLASALECASGTPTMFESHRRNSHRTPHQAWSVSWRKPGSRLVSGAKFGLGRGAASVNKRHSHPSDLHSQLGGRPTRTTTLIWTNESADSYAMIAMRERLHCFGEPLVCSFPV